MSEVQQIHPTRVVWGAGNMGRTTAWEQRGREAATHADSLLEGPQASATGGPAGGSVPEARRHCQWSCGLGFFPPLFMCPGWAHGAASLPQGQVHSSVSR